MLRGLDWGGIIFDKSIFIGALLSSYNFDGGTMGSPNRNASRISHFGSEVRYAAFVDGVCGVYLITSIGRKNQGCLGVQCGKLGYV